MSGDKIQSSVQFYYTTTNANNTGAGGINSLVANIATLVGNSISPSGVIKSGAASLGTDLSAQTALVNALNTPHSTSGSNQAPKAYLHILLFNEQFQFDATNSKVVPVTYTVGSWGTISRIGANAVSVKKNGYAYVYFSNESDELVYFDNFNLTHERGPILEETHYYPFGLTMAGISSRAMGKTQNRYKFNEGTELENKEFSDGNGLELYGTTYRSYDPQIGRFHQIDMLSEDFEDWSPYTFAFNNPILFNDPNGLEPEPPGKNDPVETLAEVFVTAKIKRLDYANGQVLKPLSWWQSMFMDFGERRWNGYVVDNNGYFVDWLPRNARILSGIAETGDRKITKTAAKTVSKWLVYRAMKKKNDKLMLYIGKAKHSIKKRYSNKEADEIMAEAIKGLDNLPDNATALGVEQAILTLNGGVANTANKMNAAAKEKYIVAGREWLEANIPNWKELFKYQ